jgi:biopolymer transport protein ExbD
VRLATKRRPDPMIDVTPMIDIVFQLVLFFMVSTTFISAPGIQVDLPRSSAQTVLTEQRELNIWMTPQGAVYVDDNPVTGPELRDAFRAAAERDTGTLVIIKADTAVEHGRVVAVMDLARSEGLGRLAIATEAPDQ